MKRRAFITLLGSAAAWPIAARAQQSERARLVGVLNTLRSDDAEAQARHAAFLQGLQEAGWAIGRNVRIDVRWGQGNADRTRKLAPELAAVSPDAIFTSGEVGVTALLQHTRTVPIVFAIVPDPVGSATSRAWHGQAATPLDF